MIYKIILFIGIGFNIAAQFLLKKGAVKLNVLLTDQSLFGKLKIITSLPLIWGALLCYGAGFAIYTVVLTKMNLNVAYPISSAAAIIAIFLLSVVFLKEAYNIFNIVGLILCIIGIILLFR